MSNTSPPTTFLTLVNTVPGEVPAAQFWVQQGSHEVHPSVLVSTTPVEVPTDPSQPPWHIYAQLGQYQQTPIVTTNDPSATVSLVAQGASFVLVFDTSPPA